MRFRRLNSSLPSSSPSSSCRLVFVLLVVVVQAYLTFSFSFLPPNTKTKTNRTVRQGNNSNNNNDNNIYKSHSTLNSNLKYHGPPPLYAVKNKTSKSKKGSSGGVSNKKKDNNNISTKGFTEKNDNNEEEEQEQTNAVKVSSITTASSSSSSPKATKAKEEIDTKAAIQNVQNRGKSSYAQQLLQERKEEEIRMKNELLAMKKFQEERRETLATGGGNLPEKVSNRILQRMVPFLSIPVLFGIGMFFTYFYLAKKLDIYIPPYIVAYSTQIPFLFALLGITYSVLSASWEEDVEGSKLGIDEFRKNLGSLFESLQYNKKVEQMDENVQKYQEQFGKDISELDENTILGNREQRRRSNRSKNKN